jgi:DNA-binding XRE family transcriptional regulator
MADGQSIVAGPRRALGAELAARRTEQKLTQAQLAERLHVHRTTITHLEAGNHGASLAFWELVDDILVASGVLMDAYRRMQTAVAAHQRHKADAAVERYRSAAVQHRSEGRVVPGPSHTLADLSTLLDNAITESVDLTAATETTSLGSVGMERLQADVKSLAGAQLSTSVSRAAYMAILARRRIFRFLHSSPSSIQELQLYFLAGQLSGLLSHACKADRSAAIGSETW